MFTPEGHNPLRLRQIVFSFLFFNKKINVWANQSNFNANPNPNPKDETEMVDNKLCYVCKGGKQHIFSRHHLQLSVVFWHLAGGASQPRSLLSAESTANSTTLLKAQLYSLNTRLKQTLQTSCTMRSRKEGEEVEKVKHRFICLIKSYLFCCHSTIKYTCKTIWALNSFRHGWDS